MVKSSRKNTKAAPEYLRKRRSFPSWKKYKSFDPPMKKKPAPKPPSLVTYTTGDPTDTIGVYACRVDHPQLPGMLHDQFLMWTNGKWWYLGSDQKYRGPVHGWIGPLSRTLPS